MSAILLINPPVSPVTDSRRIPLNLIALGAVLERAGFGVEIIDFDLLTKEGAVPLNSTFVSKALAVLKGKGEFDYFGITSLATNYHVAFELAEGLKKLFPQKKIIFGGPQATATADLTLRECKYVDILVRGEADKSVVELMQALEEGSALSAIDGVSFRKGSQIIHNPPVKLIKNVDEIPIPAFHLLDMKKYIVSENPGIQIEGGRGCPYACTFCSTNDMWERRYRVKSPKRLIEEMTYVYEKFGVSDFDLIHDNFALNKKYIHSLCDALGQYPIKFTWACSSRADNVDQETLKMMGENGCREIFYGIESGNQARQISIKKRLNLNNSISVVRSASESGLNPVCSFIIGFEDETDNELNQTLLYAIECRVAGASVVQLPVLQPHNGSPLFLRLQDNLMYDPIMEAAHAIYKGETLSDEMKKRSKILFPYTLSFRAPKENARLNAIRRVFASIIEAYPLTIKAYIKESNMNPLALFSVIYPLVPKQIYDETDTIRIRNTIVSVFEKYLESQEKSALLCDIFTYEKTLQSFLDDDFSEIQMQVASHPIGDVIAYLRGQLPEVPQYSQTYILFVLEQGQVNLYEVDQDYYQNLIETYPTLKQKELGYA